MSMAAEATAVAVTTNKAGFWVRFFAIFIDGLGVGIVSNIISGVMGADPMSTSSSSINTLLGVLYFCYFWSAQGGGQTLGMRVLITDHHLPAEQLPDAWCIVNPNQQGCGFPSKHLAGVGVMFYLMLALRAELRMRRASAIGLRGIRVCQRRPGNLGQADDSAGLERRGDPLIRERCGRA